MKTTTTTRKTMTTNQKIHTAFRVERRKPFKCQECGKELSLKQAEKAMYGDHGCPGCGGVDIDIN